ncbi:hypothetical protein D9757_011347 [Collybiopsis confluens]|uniref:SET domain-containing protein n=1 Tax=Collybiopsis confluens TaxID=2823264 RepID=A0A8H5GGB7_9AGAR|nr:hypothetical protein D9757_011347 [Collybiopsis confluens]
MKVVFDRMPPENQKAFMELANSHTQDGSDDITGRIRTNGVVTGFRDRNSSGAQGRYTAICKDISRINHSCRPNASWSWHTDSFSLRVCAVRDIRAGEEVTVAYCDALAPAAERAEALVPYGIYNCNCGPSCNDPAGIRIGDKRRDRFRFEPVVVFAPHVPPKVGEAPDAWVKPALRRFRELEAEGLEGCNEYHRTAYQLINVYCFLQDVEKVKKYASKIKGVHRVIEKKEFPASFSSAEGIERSQYYQMSEMRKKAGIPESAPILISFA